MNDTSKKKSKFGKRKPIEIEKVSSGWEVRIPRKRAVTYFLKKDAIMIASFAARAENRKVRWISK